MKTLKRMLCLFLSICLFCNVQIVASAAEDNETTGGIIVDEDASKDLVLYGDASRQENGVVELTSLSTWQSGSVWYGRQIAASSGFTTKFDYWAGGGRGDSYGGADGIVLTFSKETGLGSDGEYMGFVPGSYGVELDSYFQNTGDPSGKHIAIIQNAVSNHLTYVLDDRVDDSQWHTLKVEYKSNVLTVFLDGQQMLSQENVVLPDQIYLGISAATGSGKNQHLIKNFYMEGIVSEGESFVEDTDPIIVIPGIMGSRLFTSNTVFDDTTRVWDPPKDTPGQLWDISKLNERLANNNPLYVRPCENQNDKENGTVATYGREYGALNTYKKLVDGLCDAYPDREVYVFSYDWRKSNRENAKNLADVIKTIHSEKIDLVCHSMGGLVASSYYDQYGSQKIDKIITCGTPYEGAPKLINSVQNWDVLGEGVAGSGDDWIDLGLGIWGGMTKKLKSSFLGVAQLTPTENYVSKIPMQKDHWAPFGWADYNLKYEDYVKICEKIFGKDNYENAKDFQESLHDSTGYNALLNYDKAYFLVGINQKTITAIKFQFSNNDIDDCLYESDLSYDTSGDGTVPYLSASIMEKIEELPASRWTTESVTHTGVVENADCIDWVEDILQYGVSTKAKDELENKPYTVVRIACPVDVTLTSGDETLASDNEQLSSLASFGRMDILGENNEIKLLCIDTEEDYDIQLNGTDEGTMNYAIRFYDGEGNLYDERIFDEVPLTEDTVIHTDVTPEEETKMEVDADGDGTVEETWTAKEAEWITEDDDSRVPLENISASVENSVMKVGTTQKVEVNYQPLDTTDKVGIDYTSSDETVAIVDSEGTVTAIAPGTVTIQTKASNGMTSEVTLTVEATTAEELTFKLSAAKFVYNGKVKTPTVTITDANGTKLVKGTDYDVTYASGRKNVGRYAVTVTLKGNYTGTKKVYFTIVPKKTGSLTSIRYQYGNQIRLSWKKCAGATGYRIEYKKPGASKYTFLANTKNLYYTKAGLTANKTYYFKVTPYVTIGGTKYYGTSSSAYKTTSIATVKKGSKLAQISKPTITKSGTKVKVKWKNVANETGYEISQSTSKTGTKIVSTYKTTSGTSKLVAATKGKTYYYKVRVYRTVNGKKIYGAWSTVVKYKR